MRRNLRVAAYAVCVRDEQILLARSPAPDGTPEWVLPGGGMEHGEDPYDTVRREVMEETGYRIEVTGLLGVDSFRLVQGARFGRRTDHHALRLVYEGEVVGGELRYEVGGSTDFAAWQDLSAVPGLNRVPVVDTALRLWRERPAHGHLTAGTPPVPQEVNGE
ncbi:NUDIX hydrolase [Streptomyces sp. NBC_00557]|jgi:8-oxo-dGTP pyrophosphatase MutT (NUDIX family)|uniref:NUDIX hydrolase n=1 Tax=Streptomyces sp. NBC_00557 TaxID=2975776 RepID=UPI002E8181B8|nr:NUDIX hydrolase [Streptomyces sp. NBC_00557]WUC36946.1 NUDIX hydrolase [Streptomyces sp. NBC_00557]